MKASLSTIIRILIFLIKFLMKSVSLNQTFRTKKSLKSIGLLILLIIINHDQFLKSMLPLKLKILMLLRSTPSKIYSRKIRVFSAIKSFNLMTKIKNFRSSK